MERQPNLGYADVKLDFACMHLASFAHMLSICVFYNLYGDGLIPTLEA